MIATAYIRKKAIKYKDNPEMREQKAFAKWFAAQYPTCKDFLTVASFGENIGARRMKRLKDMGLTPGWPDLFLAIPKRLNENSPIICPGFFIEMKVKGGAVEPHQQKIHEKLRSVGFRVDVCWSCDEAIDSTKDYLKDTMFDINSAERWDWYDKQV